jgi:hypothetical protein
MSELRKGMTMKRVIFLNILIFLSSSGLLGQTVYQVPVSSKGNSIMLTVANESRALGASMLSVKPAGSHPGLKFTPQATTIKTLAAQAETDVSFSFDVGREAKVGKKDTLVFEIRDASGGSWMKSVILDYTAPKEYRLQQNFPNPFNPTTTIYYDLPHDSRVSIKVYDIIGREVRSLVNGVEEAGSHDIRFDGRNLASGAYVYRLQADPIAGGKGFSDVKKLIVLR